MFTCGVKGAIIILHTNFHLFAETHLPLHAVACLDAPSKCHVDPSVWQVVVLLLRRDCRPLDLLTRTNHVELCWLQPGLCRNLG